MFQKMRTALHVLAFFLHRFNVCTVMCWQSSCDAQHNLTVAVLLTATYNAVQCKQMKSIQAELWCTAHCFQVRFVDSFIA